MGILDKLTASVGAGISQGYANSGTSYGSSNTAYSYNNAVNGSESYGWSSGASGTDATTAREWSAEQAEIAWMRDMYAMELQMEYNREEAEKNRQWQADMANTIYTRSIKNMKEAGINPILASNMGLSGAYTGSGATASLGGVPNAPLAQSFMDSWSAQSSYNHGSSWGNSNGESWGNGSSWGNGWSNSEEGIVTALNALGDMAGSALQGINAANILDDFNKRLGEKTENRTSIIDKIKNGVGEITGKISEKLDDVKNHGKQYAGGGGGHGFKRQ